MPDETSPEQPQSPAPTRPARRGKPWGYLVFSVLLLGVFLAMVLKPDLPRQLLGGDPPRPADLGDSPATAGNVSGGGLGERELAAAMADLGTISLAKPAPVAAVRAPDAGTAKPVAAPAPGADEGKAAAALAEEIGRAHV